jgi:secernin
MFECMCDSVAVTLEHSALGSTLFAKNSDRKLGECQPFVQHPAAFHPRGSKLQCTHIEIPQVAETYRVMGHSPWWIWGFEHGVNEHGVAIGNQTVFSREPVEEKAGLIGMDLVRLGLERGRDAREALEVIAALLEARGQGGAAIAPNGSGYHNSFLIADANVVWELETSGRRWAARRIERAALTNHITLGTDWEIGSRDLETFARAEGWWRESGRVDVAAAYRNEHVPGILSEGRRGRSLELLADEDKHDVSSLKRLLRDHLEAGISPPIGVGPEDAAFFTLCMHAEPVGTTTASMIAPLPTDRVAPWPVWVSFATPCTGIFVPVYLEGTIPAELARGVESAQEGSAWWILHQLSEAAASDFARHTPRLRKAWAAIEESIESERKSIEARARAAAVAGELDEAASILTVFMQRTIDAVLARARDLRQQILE